MDLSKKELLNLKKELKEENICSGPFVKNNKMCPTTTALSIKLKAGKFKNGEFVSKKLKELDISKLRLSIFYLTFDLPAMISQKYFRKCLINFQKAIDVLIKDFDK